MRIHRLLASIIAATLGAAPAAMAMPGGGTQNDHANTTEDSVHVEGRFGEAGVFFLDAASSDQVNGPSGGRALLGWGDDTDFFIVSCAGATLASAVSVDKTTGRSAVHLVLDPTSPECDVFTSNISTTVLLEASGTPNGESTSSQTGTSTSTFGGVTFRENFQTMGFSETFAVNWDGFSVSSFGGSASTLRRTDRTQTK